MLKKKGKWLKASIPSYAHWECWACLCALQKGDRYSSPNQLCLDKCSVCAWILPVNSSINHSWEHHRGLWTGLLLLEETSWNSMQKVPWFTNFPVLAKDTSTSILPLSLHLYLPLPLQRAEISSVYTLLPVEVPVISSSHCSAPEICCHPCDAANPGAFFCIFMSWAKAECNWHFQLKLCLHLYMLTVFSATPDSHLFQS